MKNLIYYVKIRYEYKIEIMSDCILKLDKIIIYLKNKMFRIVKQISIRHGTSSIPKQRLSNKRIFLVTRNNKIIDPKKQISICDPCKLQGSDCLNLRRPCAYQKPW